MDTSKDFQSKWMAGADLQGRMLKATIKNVTRETVKNKEGKDEQKLAVTFAGGKPLLLNKTNYLAIVAASGGSKETGDWIGKQVVLYPESVTAFGATTIAVRIRPLPAPALPLVTAPELPLQDVGDLDEQAEAEAMSEMEPF